MSTGFFEPSVDAEFPADSLDDRLRDLGLSNEQVALVMVELMRDVHEGGTGSALKVLEEFRVMHSTTLDGACLMVALFHDHGANLSAIATRFGVPRQAVHSRVKGYVRKFASSKTMTNPA